MATVWFVLVAAMLVGYAVLDGFDLGAGVVHWFVAPTERERATVIRTIGPVWDGNEVWLVAAGGTLLFAFPALYASSFSGFYLPLTIVLWLLILRAVGIEFRGHIDAPIWKELFDGAFAVSSALLAIMFGAALGNVVRGVPLGSDHQFFEPLWTDFRASSANAILDWYTALCGIVALAALAQHGAAWIAVKTTGPLQARARAAIGWLWPWLALLTLASLVASVAVQPTLTRNYQHHPAGLIIPAVVAASLISVLLGERRHRDRGTFVSSAAYIASMLAGAAFAIYPRVLPASTGDDRSLTIYNTAAGPYSLGSGISWWAAGMVVAIGYFVVVYRTSAGPVHVDTPGH